jgi:hypothetical protein
MVVRGYFPLLAVLLSCTAKTGQPEATTAGSQAPTQVIEAAGGAAGATATSGATAAQPPHVALEGDDPSLTDEQRALAPSP